MARNCTCPTHFNIFVGLFLVALAIVGFIKLFEVVMPLWLSIIILIIGLLTLILNLMNRLYVNADDLSIDQTNEIHANEGF